MIVQPFKIIRKLFNRMTNTTTWLHLSYQGRLILTGNLALDNTNGIDKAKKTQLFSLPFFIF